MTEANVSIGNVNELGDDLRIAQESMNLPEVQEMLRRLSKFNLGICMPHMHDEETGGFQPLPKELVQVEAGLEVSFRTAEEVRSQLDCYVPVAWFWRDEMTNLGPVAAMCYSYCEKPGPRENHDRKHRHEP